MGILNTSLTLTNPVKRNLNAVEVTTLVDSSATYFCIPEHLAYHLRLKELEKGQVTLGNASFKLVSHVGSVKFNFENKSCFTGALVPGDQTLLGAIAMEDMDVVIQPKLLTVHVNPNSPNIASGLAK